MSEFLKQAGELILATTFSAGVSFGLLKAFMRQARKDLNGIGGKVRDQERATRGEFERRDDQLLAIAVTLLVMAPDRDRRLFAQWILESSRKR